MANSSAALGSNASFDKTYNIPPYWFLTDTRIPQELKSVINDFNPKTSLELGCGLGRFSTYAAQQGIANTAIDFSVIAIDRAKAQAAREELKPSFLIGNVTNLHALKQPFDMAFDMGCFHCLDRNEQEKYVAELHRLLKPNATLLIWCMKNSPNKMKLTPEYIEEVFGKQFELYKSKVRRKGIIASHWYWLEKKMM